MLKFHVAHLIDSKLNILHFKKRSEKRIII